MNLYELSIEKGFKTTYHLFEYIKNKELKTTNAPGLVSGHSYPKKFKTGDLITAGRTNTTIAENTSVSNIEFVNNIPTGKTGIYLKQLELATITKEDLKNELKTIKEKSIKQIDSLEKKINILEELGMEEYNEKLISIVDAVGAINKNAKPEEKLKLAEALLVALEK